MDNLVENKGIKEGGEKKRTTWRQVTSLLVYIFNDLFFMAWNAVNGSEWE
jgi:hypothetical protein